MTAIYGHTHTHTNTRRERETTRTWSRTSGSGGLRCGSLRRSRLWRFTIFRTLHEHATVSSHATRDDKNNHTCASSCKILKPHFLHLNDLLNERRIFNRFHHRLVAGLICVIICNTNRSAMRLYMQLSSTFAEIITGMSQIPRPHNKTRRYATKDAFCSAFDNEICVRSSPQASCGKTAISAGEIFNASYMVYEAPRYKYPSRVPI